MTHENQLRSLESTFLNLSFEYKFLDDKVESFYNRKINYLSSIKFLQ